MANKQQALPQRKIPMRQCLGCNEHKPKNELIRILRTPEGEITLEKEEDGSYVVKYDLKDCQGYPRRITGQTLLDVIPVI